MPIPRSVAKLLRYPALTVMGKFRFSEIGIFMAPRAGKCPIANSGCMTNGTVLDWPLVSFFCRTPESTMVSVSREAL